VNCKFIHCKILYKILGYNKGSVPVLIVIIGDGTLYVYRMLTQRDTERHREREREREMIDISIIYNLSVKMT
jgi:hypothetical protein